MRTRPNIQEMEWVSLFSDPQKDDDSLITLKDEKITVKNYIVPWWKKVKTLEN